MAEPRQGPSGLRHGKKTAARDRAVQAAVLGYHHARAIHYTQGSARWQGIADTRFSRKGEYPTQADCSSFCTWCLWNALKVAYGVKDVVNGANWTAGYTGTMLSHGNVVEKLADVRRGDLVLYGNGAPGKHVAIVVGKKNKVPMVVSHGSEGGPYYVAYNYRSDIMCIRRYI